MKDNEPVAAVTIELGIHLNTIYKWILQVSDYQVAAFPGSGNSSPEDEESCLCITDCCCYQASTQDKVTEIWSLHQSPKLSPKKGANDVQRI
jgi:hypothetical protein